MLLYWIVFLILKVFLHIIAGKYKYQNAFCFQEHQRKINYFNYKFDVFSLAKAIKNKLYNISKNRVLIISEPRYEFLTTCLSNFILGNTVIIITSNVTKKMVEKTLLKYNINTVFFSNTYKDIVLSLYKKNNNEKKKSIVLTNLINFGSLNQYPIIKYEKFLNIGRYLENYSLDTFSNLPLEHNAINNTKINKLNILFENISSFLNKFINKSAPSISSPDSCCTILVSEHHADEIKLGDFISLSLHLGIQNKIRKFSQVEASNILNKESLTQMLFMPFLYGLCISFNSNVHRSNFILLRSSPTIVKQAYSTQAKNWQMC